MKRPASLTAALSVAAAVPLFALAPAASAEEIVIGVGGNGERFAHEQGSPTVMDGILADQAARGALTRAIDYTSSVWPTGPYLKDYSVREGRDKLNAQIAAERAANPDAEITVVGHSLGAEVVDESVDADKVILLGDPRASNGVYAALPGVYPGAANPGPRDAQAEGVVSVCREFDGICDVAAPWEDPAKFVQGAAGFAMGWHGYSPEEVEQYSDAAPGEYMIEAPAPLPWLPESTPTGIPALPPVSLPEIPLPAPLPSTQDFAPLASVGQPYTPTPIEEFVPEWVEPVLPPEVLNFVPPPLPVIPGF